MALLPYRATSRLYQEPAAHGLIPIHDLGSPIRPKKMSPGSGQRHLQGFRSASTIGVRKMRQALQGPTRGHRLAPASSWPLQRLVFLTTDNRVASRRGIDQ